MTKIILLAFACVLGTNSAALAALPDGISLTHNNRVVHIDRGVHTYTPPPGQTAKRTVIFDNLATRDPKGVYMAGNGNTVGGPNAVVGQAYQAAAFTPAANARVSEVQVAVGYIEGRKNAVLINIYADASGAPGSLLWSQKAAVPVFGDCCAVAKAQDKAGLQLTAGTQYWVGVTTPANASDFFGAWSFNVADQITTGVTATDLGNGWIVNSSLPDVAFAIFGN